MMGMLLVLLSVWSVQFRVRTESRTEWDYRAPTWMRTRLTWVEEYGKVKAFLQIQDSRMMGEELATLGDGHAENLDFHQAYVEIRDGAGKVRFRVGRMEVKYANERFLGAVGWDNVGRSMDGAVLRWSSGETGWVDLFSYYLRYDLNDPLRTSLNGMWMAWRELHLFAVAESWESGDFRNRYTAGGLLRMTSSLPVGVQVEWALQGGNRRVPEVPIRALFLSLQGTVRGMLRVGLDYASGDDPGTPADEAFHTLYATNHKFYGFMDFFTNLPRHTDRRGLQDLYVGLHVPLPGIPLKGRVDVHHFRDAREGRIWGTEVDGTLRGALGPGVVFQGGVSVMFPGELGRMQWGYRRPLLWVYTMLTVTPSSR